jgi:C4-dicarboxylate-specific signal transduction histidine kinase
VGVAISIDQSVYLAGWEEERNLGIGLTLILSILKVLVSRRSIEHLARRETAGRLAAERQLLATLIDTPLALCAVVSRTGRVIYANGRFAQVLGQGGDSSSALRNNSLRGAEEVLHFANSPQDGTFELDLRLENSDGTARFLHFSLSHQDLPGLGNCTVMVGHDETERYEARQAIAQSAKLVTLGELTTGMAHELSQPLNVMRMAAQNALMEIEAAQESAAVADPRDLGALIAVKLDRIVFQIDRAADIVARMRIFGRAPKGPPSNFDVRVACRAAIALVEVRLKAAGLTIRLNLGETALTVTGYQNLLEQVLVNLLLNARDSLEGCDQSAKTIDVSARRDQDNRIQLIVADNGPGVPASIRDRIFEPFFTSKPIGRGTGLGLATSFGIVRDAGGNLSLLSRGAGAAFQVDLPAAA